MGAAMLNQTFARYAAVIVLLFICLVLAGFMILAPFGFVVGDGVIGQLFILIVRQDGGIFDFVKQAMLPVIAATTLSIRFAPKKDRLAIWLWALLIIYAGLLLIFYFEFQLTSIAEEIWVNDERGTFIRDPGNIPANQASFEAAIRYFVYQSAATVLTSGLVLLGIRMREPN